MYAHAPVSGPIFGSRQKTTAKFELVGRRAKREGRRERFEFGHLVQHRPRRSAASSGNISNPTLSHLIATCLAGCCPSDKFKNVRRIPGQDITRTQLTIKPTNQPPR